MTEHVLREIRPKGEQALSLSVLLRDSETVTLTVGRSVYDAVGAPAVGESLSTEQYGVLLREHGRREAYRAAIRILECGSPSGKALYLKLLRKGVSRENADFAVSRMKELGYIREGEQARALAASMVRRNLWGPRRVYAALCEKGYSGKDASEAIEAACDAGEIDFPEARRALVQREMRKGAPPERLRAVLYRYGYGSDGE